MHRLLLGAALVAFGRPVDAARQGQLLAEEAAPPAAYTSWLQSVRSGEVEPGDGTLAAMMEDGPGRRLLTRIAAVEHTRNHPHPSLGPALMRVFARARFGELPEDPDLFERALRAVALLPEREQRRALREGLAPVLARLAYADLSRRWLEPALVGQPASVQRAVLRWPTQAPRAWAALERQIAIDLDAAWERSGPALIPAMSVEGGSIAHAASRRVTDAVMGALLRDAPPAARRPLIGVAVGRGEDGPALHAALRQLADVDPTVATAAATALDRLPGQPLPAIAPPAIAPGRTPGLEHRPQAQPDAAMRTAGAGPHRAPPSGWAPALLALGLLVSAGVAGARSRRRHIKAAAGLGLGAALVLMVEAGGRLVGVPLLADTAPLLAFVQPGAAVLEVPPTGEPGWRQTAGGSVRAALFPARPAAGTTRVAFLGASTTHGSHALAEETFAAVATSEANDILPGTPLEGINLGVGGATSAVVRAAGEAALAAGAQVLVVYYGHNEVDQLIRLGGYTGMDPRGIGLRMRLHRSALYSLLRRALPAATPTAVQPDPAGPPDRERLVQLKSLAATHHAWNLSALLRAADAASAQVILMPTATNYRFAHLEPQAQAGPGDAEDLAARLAHADLLARGGDHAGARQAWQQAIDVAAWPRETTAAVDAATRTLATRHGCASLDVAGLFAARAPDGLTASGLFWDDLHPTPEGHRIIGEALAPLLVQAHERRP